MNRLVAARFGKNTLFRDRISELSIILISRVRKLLLLILFAYDDSFVILIRARFNGIYESSDLDAFLLFL